MHDDESFCAAMADADDVPDKQKVPRKARGSIAKAAMAFVRDHGDDYPNKDAAMTAFKAQYLEDRKQASSRPGAIACKVGETQVVGFGILTAIVINLLCYFFQRFWTRQFPNK